MNEEELKEPKLIWKGTTAEALRLGKVTQEDVDRWNRNDVEGESFSNGYDEGFQKGKLEQKKEDNNILIKYSKLRLYRSKSCQLLIKQLQKEIGR